MNVTESLYKVAVLVLLAVSLIGRSIRSITLFIIGQVLLDVLLPKQLIALLGSSLPVVCQTGTPVVDLASLKYQY